MESTAVSPPPLSLELPGGFHPLPVGASVEEREEAVSALVKEVYPRGDAALWQGMAPLLDQVTTSMADADLAFAALGLFGTGSAGVAHCALTVAVAPSRHPTQEAAAQGIREILTRTSSVDAEYLELPCGPAVMGISIQDVTYDGRFTTTGADATIRMGRLQAFLPFPTGPYLAVLTLETPAMDFWENFSVMMGTILVAVRFPARGDGDGASA